MQGTDKRGIIDWNGNTPCSYFFVRNDLFCPEKMHVDRQMSGEVGAYLRNRAAAIRTQRSGWKNKITFSMFYHLEHHLFPAVPTIKLPELVRRIDEALPEIEKKAILSGKNRINRSAAGWEIRPTFAGLHENILSTTNWRIPYQPL